MDISKDQLEDLITHLEINLHNIHHVLFTDGTEMIGEVLDSFPITQTEKEEFAELLYEMDEVDDYVANENEEDYLELVDSNGEEVEFAEDGYYRLPEENSILFLNPIRIYRDTWVDPNSGDMKHTNYFVDFNPCIDGPYVPIYKHSIASINPPNDETLVAYLKAVYKIYFPLLSSEVTDGSVSSSDSKAPMVILKVSPKNIIDFTSYLKKRQTGNF